MPDTKMVKYEPAAVMPITLEDGSQAELKSISLEIPDEFIYYIGKGPDGERRGGILSSMWAVVSREMAIQYTDVKILDESDTHIKIEIHASFLNTHGQIVRDTVIVKISSRLQYEESRLKWMPKKWNNQDRCYEEDTARIKELQAQGFLIDTIVYDENDVPKAIKRKLPPDVERELMLNFLTVQKNLLAKADTVGKRKITQRACGFSGVKMPDKKSKEQVTLQIYNIMRKSGVQVNPNEIRVQAEAIDLATDEVDEPGTSKVTDTANEKTPDEKETKQEQKKEVEKPSENAGNEEKFYCNDCGEAVSKKVFEYKGLGKCFNCQKR